MFTLLGLYRFSLWACHIWSGCKCTANSLKKLLSSGCFYALQENTLLHAREQKCETFSLTFSCEHTVGLRVCFSSAQCLEQH